MTNPECLICTELFEKISCIPILLNPCGHSVCKTCYKNWKIKSCPFCRKEIENSCQNNTLIDLLEKQKYHYSTLLKKYNFLVNRKNIYYEILRDNCDESIVIIDNGNKSVSGRGFIFTKNFKGIYRKIENICKWDIVIIKVREIYEYNLKRNVKTTIYLLNPLLPNEWELDIDYIVIDPVSIDMEKNIQTLNKNILSKNNIRGSNPLDIIIKKLKSEFDIHSYIHDINICLNIITDNFPDNKVSYKISLENISKTNNIFIVYNFSQANDNLEFYYKNINIDYLLDINIILDYEAELSKTMKMNNFFVYSYELHKCRQAGCYSVLSNQMTKTIFPIHYMNKLFRELYRKPQPKIENHNIIHGLEYSFPNSYLRTIKKWNDATDLVFNYESAKFENLIDLKKINWILWKNYLLRKCLVYSF